MQRTKPIFSPPSDRRVLTWLFYIRQERLRLGPVAFVDEPHARTLWRECLRAAESSLRALWSARLLTQEASEAYGQETGGIVATAAALQYHARWQARQALYLLNEFRRHQGW